MIAAVPGLPPSVPGYWRRLASFVYEGVVLFGVVMVAGFAYSVLTRQRHALQGSDGLKLVLFLVLGLYFVWFWTHGGQTVAMKTWRIRVVARSGRPLTALRATARYVASWMWFLPALATAHLARLEGSGPMLTLVLVGVLTYAGLALLRSDRQYWHDVICGTMLVHVRDDSSRR